MEPRSERTTVRRGKVRAVYDEAMLAVVDAGTIAHVGVVTDDGPIVLPMAYGRDDHHLYLHGAAANALLRAGAGADVCVTITIVDGLVLARTPFHHSMNYRSVVVRGPATVIDDPVDKLRALRLVSDRLVPTWETTRPPSESEVRRTMVVSVPLDEMSGKVRAGDPIDEADDVAGPHWAGTVAVEATWGEPVTSADLTSQAPIPAAVAALAGTPLHPST